MRWAFIVASCFGAGWRVRTLSVRYWPTVFSLTIQLPSRWTHCVPRASANPRTCWH